ncbi:MAG: carbohydrate-binding protein [Methanospirillum sp.]|mgnify:CR=1 FL=1|nr:carbohydrate-binding protein [Methanospirillum sp.]
MRTRSIVLILLLLGSSVPAFAAGETYLFERGWGGLGTGTGQFNYTWGIAVDGNANVYVADFYNHRIQKFASNGTFLAKWGTYGSGNGQLNHPTSVAVDGTGHVYVADYYNHRIQKFTSTGAFIAKWGGIGSADGQMTFPYGVGVDRAGNVYVADYYNHRVQKFSPTGAFLAKWGSRGTDDGKFQFPCGVAVDSHGTVYVADQYNHRVQVFAPNGTFIAKMGGDGAADGDMHYPTHIAFDAADNVYVCDHGNHRIQKFTPARVFVTKWGTRGSAWGEFYSPTSVALDGAGTIYVADTNNNRVQVFSRQGAVPTPNTTPTPKPTPKPTPTPTPVPQEPYPAPHAPGDAIRAEDFDTGGEGVAYHDLEPANLGGAYRPAEGVDIETVGGVTNVGWIRAGEWLRYTVDAVANGSFGVVLRAANPDPFAKAVRVYLDGVPAGEVVVNGTGGWGAFAEFAGPAPVTVSKGRHVLTLAFEGVERLNLDLLSLPVTGPTVTPTPTVSPTSTAAPTITVTPTPTANITPAASFEANRTFGEAPFAVAFKDTSKNGPTSWTWDFGDGVGSSQQHPVHLYTVPGTFTAGLTATNAYGSNTSAQEIVVVARLPYTLPIPADGSRIPPNTTVGVERGSTHGITVDAMESAMVLRKNGTGEVVNGSFVDGRIRTYTDPLGRLLGSRGWLNRSYETLENGTQYDLYYGTDLVASYTAVEYPVLAVPGCNQVPRDGDRDGLFEDLNGNGRPDFADVELFFDQMAWIAEHEPFEAFDCNANGRIDFADVTWLFNHL